MNTTAAPAAPSLAERMPPWCLNVALLAVATSLSLLVAVAGLVTVSEHRLADDVNFHDPNTRFDPELGWAPIPSRSIVTWGGTRVSSDAAGLRSPEVDRSKGHVLVVGDSVVWGYKVDDDQTVSRWLQDLLDGERPDLQVLNLGVSGYGIDQYYLFLKRKLDEIPSTRAVVVVITTVNDWKNTGANTAYGKSKPLFVIGPDGELHNVSGRISRHSLVNLTSTWRLPAWARAFLARHSGLREIPEGERRAVVQALLAKIGALAASRGARLLFVLSPAVPDFRGEPTGDLRRFRELLAATGGDTLDFKEYLEGQRKVSKGLYRDPVHYSPEGHRLLAQAIFERLRPVWP